ncbi:MAG: recombinase family protein [Candidatus Rokuibacteriota bacterium]
MEADLVRRIYGLYAQGRGPLKIARMLNDEGVANPSGQDRSRPSKKASRGP